MNDLAALLASSPDNKPGRRLIGVIATVSPLTAYVGCSTVASPVSRAGSYSSPAIGHTVSIWEQGASRTAEYQVIP